MRSPRTSPRWPSRPAPTLPTTASIRRATVATQAPTAGPPPTIDSVGATNARPQRADPTDTLKAHRPGTRRPHDRAEWAGHPQSHIGRPLVAHAATRSEYHGDALR